MEKKFGKFNKNWFQTNFQLFIHLTNWKLHYGYIQMDLITILVTILKYTLFIISIQHEKRYLHRINVA